MTQQETAGETVAAIAAAALAAAAAAAAALEGCINSGARKP